MSDWSRAGSDLPPANVDDAPTTYYGSTSGSAMDRPAPMGDFGGQDTGSTGDQAKEKATQAADTAKDKAGQAADTAKQKAGEAADTAKQKAGEVADQASTKVDVGMDKAAGGLDKAASLLRDKSASMGGEGSTVQSVATKAATQLDTASQYLQQKDTDQLMADLEGLVRQKPAQTLLVAAGVGFLLSKVVR